MLRNLMAVMSQPDKKKHFVAGLLISSLCGWGIFAFTMDPRHTGLGLVAAGIAGFLKEVYDAFTPGKVETRDFLATLLGGVPPAIPFFFTLV